MPSERLTTIVRALASHGYNAEREAVTLLARSPDPIGGVETVVESVPEETLRITADDVEAVLSPDPIDDPDQITSPEASDTTARPTGDDRSTTGSATDEGPTDGRTEATAIATPDRPGSSDTTTTSADTAISDDAEYGQGPAGSSSSSSIDRSPAAGESTAAGAEAIATGAEGSAVADRGTPPERAIEIRGDMTGESTGTGAYDEFVTVFRDRYERLSKLLRGRVNHRPAEAIAGMSGGSEAAMIGLVNDVRSTSGGHWLVELEDTTGTFPCLVTKDKEIAELVRLLLYDECIAVEGRLSDDAGILFVDSLYFPDVPRTHRPNTADRHVQAALISDVHVGSQEFMADAWSRFADWLHTPEADPVEYLLIAGDMVEGVGVYPDQDEELDVVDIYDQYAAFSEYLKEVPGDLEIVMIPGNHDAVRLAEPQPGFDEELRSIMSAHDARVASNPATVTIEGVSILMYHGVSLDEVIAELPDDVASYDEPHKAMYQLLKKRHVAPQYGGKNRLAPEDRDYLVMEEVPDVFHTGHVHKVGWGKYHNVLAVNSGCWQAQTDFQKSVNIDPDPAHAPILDLDTLELTVRKFA